MMQSSTTSSTEVHSKADEDVKIPIKNIWLLMLFASDFYRKYPKIQAEAGIEDNPDNIPNFFAEILCYHVEQRLARNLSFGYQNKVAVLNTVRGRIDILYTQAHRLLDKAQICCRFEELTVDTPRNRYVCAALEHLSSIKQIDKKRLRPQCHRLAMCLHRMGVSRGKPPGYSPNRERFGLHDAKDESMLFAADFAFSLALPTEYGDYKLISPLKIREWLQRLFEKAVRRFYQVTLKDTCRVSRWLEWKKIEYKTDALKNIFPQMETDITITNKLSDERLIIDTKFCEIVTGGRYDKKLESDHIYQIYAYVMSQHTPKDPKSLTTRGMLLYPSFGVDYNESAVIQGHEFKFCTVNLGDSATKIRDRLLNLLPPQFKPIH